MIFSEQILVRVHPPLRDAVFAAAERAGLSVSELVRRTIHREISDPTAKDMPSSTAVAPIFDQPSGTRITDLMVDVSAADRRAA